MKSGIMAGLFLGSTLAASADLVTFRVNMGVQATIGNFNPSSMNVECRGAFQSPTMWTGGFALTNSPGAPDVYSGTYDVTNTVPPNFIQYKFTFNNGTYELQGLDNRFVQMTGAPQTLPVVYFDDVTTAVTNSVTFQVDMSAQVGLGRFDPQLDYATVAGAFKLLPNGAWDAASSVLYNNGNNVYTNTFDVVNGMGKGVAYKFTIDGGGTWEGNVGPGGTQNRVFTHTNQPTPLVLPAVFFNNVTANRITNTITFLVNMAVQAAQGTNFNLGIDTVTIAGDFQTPNWTPTVLTDSGSNVWYGTFDAVGSSNVNSTIAFQYVINGLNYENAIFNTGNRTLSFLSTSNTTQTLPAVFFGNVADLGPLSIGPVSGGQIPLSWNPGARIRLQSSSTLANGSWLDLPDTQGIGSTNLTIGPGAAFFRLTGP